MEISNIFNTEGIEKTKDELTAMAKAGELTPDVIASYQILNKAVQDSELFLKEGQTAAQAFCDEIYAGIEAVKALEGNITPQTFDISTYKDKREVIGINKILVVGGIMVREGNVKIRNSNNEVSNLCKVRRIRINFQKSANEHLTQTDYNILWKLFAVSGILYLELVLSCRRKILYRDGCGRQGGSRD